MTLWNGSEWVQDPPTPPSPLRRRRRFIGAAAEASLITLLIFGLIAGTALAAPGNGKGGGGKGSRDPGSMTLVVLDGASQPTHGGRVSFDVSTTATDRPFVGLRCWQATTWIYDAYVGYFDDWMYDRDWFVLDSPTWSSGIQAACTARLFYYDKRGRQKVMATNDFAVSP